MAAYNLLRFVVLSHVATFLFFNPNVAMADEALINRVCQRSSDHQFCEATFHLDARSAAAKDVLALGLLSIQITSSQIQDTLNNDIPEARMNIKNDPVGLQRLDACQSDYESAFQKFSEAFQSMSKRAFPDVINGVRDGTNLVIDCQNIYRRSEPIGESPIAGINQKVVKLSEVILAANDELMSTQAY